MRSAARSLWAEPRAPSPPGPLPRDRVLVGVLLAAVVLEAVLRTDLTWRPVALAQGVLVVALLPWRRTHPLAVVLVAFGAASAVGVATLVAGAAPVELYASVCVLLLPYALARWGAGRELVLGLPVLLLTAFVAIAGDFTGVVDAVFGALVLPFAVVLGAAVRYRATARLRGREELRLREREQLARELHDTVAHHVSAIAVQAQAGQAVAASDPAATVRTLGVIEEAASRALAEMRALVGALRDGDEPDLAPQPRVADLDRLARAAPHGPRVEVALQGDLAGLRPAVEAATYRLAQESVTNALRHARHATRIDVRVAGEPDRVRVTVHDDGDAGAGVRDASGYGLVGMTERATLLGGTLVAGPDHGTGWTVEAVLPRTGAAP